MKKIITGCLVLLLFSCMKKKQSDGPALPPEPTDGRWTQVTNLKITPQEISPGMLKIWLFNLDEGKEVPVTAVTTNQWDFMYVPDQDGARYGTIAVNYKHTRLGVALTGDAWITMVPQRFTDVVKAPPDSLFNIRITKWATPVRTGEDSATVKNYAFGSQQLTIMGWTPAHFDNPYTLPLPGYTFVFKTNKGNYAKLQIQSVFKNSPAQPDATSENNHLTFRYFVQKDKSGNLDTKK